MIQVLQPVAGESGRGRSGLLVALGVTAFGVFTWFHFTIFHGILGAIMSVFLAAEPLDLLGPNGFINGDSSELLAYLIATYLAIILATLVTRWKCILQGNPVQRMQSIYSAIIRLHVFVLLSGLLSFVAIFGEAVYQQVSGAHAALPVLLPIRPAPANHGEAVAPLVQRVASWPCHCGVACHRPRSRSPSAGY